MSGPGWSGLRQAWPATIVLVLAGAACAAHVFVPPVGPGVPAPDGADIWMRATSRCRGAGTYQADLHVSGRVGSAKLNRTVAGAVTSHDQIRLELPAPFGAPAFILAGTADAATLYFPRDHRVLSARADEIINALTGLTWGPRQLLAVLTGCVTPAPARGTPERFGPILAVDTNDGRAFLRSSDNAWVVVAGTTGEMSIDYQSVEGGWPRRILVRSAPDRAPAVTLTMSIDLEGVNVPVDPAAFTVKAAADAAPLTLDELRAMGPLGEKGGS